MTRFSSLSRRLSGVLDRVGAVVDPFEMTADHAALVVTGCGLAVCVLVYLLVPTDPARLTRFTAEHVEIFRMVDSTAQRLAFAAFFNGAGDLDVVTHGQLFAQF